MIRAKPTYSSVTRMLNPEGRRDKLRLDKNEHTVGLPEEIVQDALSGLTPEVLATYPEVRPLYEKLAKTLGVSEGNLMLAAGSDAGIKSLYEMFVSEGDQVVLLSPTYAMYSVYSKMFGAEVVGFGYGRDLSLDTDALLSAIGPRVSLVAIANPNSPTGTVIEQETLLKIVGKARDAGAVVLIDEAYHPFYPRTIMPYIREYDNLVVTRTFSKAYGVASLRLGYIAGSESMIDLLMKIQPMYEVNGVAVHFGCYILDHLDVVDRYVRQVEEGKHYLEAEMEALGFYTYPTYANFMLIRVEDERLREVVSFV